MAYKFLVNSYLMRGFRRYIDRRDGIKPHRVYVTVERKSEPSTCEVYRELLEEIVLVDNAQLIESMCLLMQGVKLAVEPAGTATTACSIYCQQMKLDVSVLK